MKTARTRTTTRTKLQEQKAEHKQQATTARSNNKTQKPKLPQSLELFLGCAEGVTKKQTKHTEQHKEHQTNKQQQQQQQQTIKNNKTKTVNNEKKTKQQTISNQ